MNNKKTIGIIAIVIFIGAAGLCYGLGAGQNDIESLMIESTLERELPTNEEETKVLVEEEVILSEIYVHICGEVVNPGVYIVKENARLIEVIELAGGLTKDASGNSINLAQSVYDGQRIEVPSISDIANMTEDDKNKLVSEILSGIESDNSNNLNKGNQININTASEAELTTLTGIGQAKAQSIIAYRESSGLFKTINEIMNVVGIKDGLFNSIKDNITVD